ncbi:molecular chaperone [Brenneria sp. 4F2]|nr:molecular chaperone [Brenneria bubanii]
MKKNIFLLFLYFIFSANFCFASITVGGTRLIYDDTERETTLSIFNSQDGVPTLIQSRIESDNGEKNIPFIITPPLFRLDPGKEGVLRIMYTQSGLAQDRESLFWLSSKAIPSTDKEATNSLMVAVKTRIKLIYRPAKLKGAQAQDAWMKLLPVLKGSDLEIGNPTPYYISLQQLKINDKAVTPVPTIAPFSSRVFYSGAKKNDRVSWKAINDYGAITNIMSRSL